MESGQWNRGTKLEPIRSAGRRPNLRICALNSLFHNILPGSPFNPRFYSEQSRPFSATSTESAFCPARVKKMRRLCPDECRNSRPRMSAAPSAALETRLSASALLEFHLLNLHAAQESAPAAAVCETLPLGLRRGHA